MTRTLIAFTAAAALAAAPAAGADEVSPRVERVRPIAAAFYPGADARCGHVQIVHVASLPTHANATAAECTIRLDNMALTYAPWVLCRALAHEFGHVDLTVDRVGDPRDGHDHSANPASIMYAGGKWSDPGKVPGCDRLEAADARAEVLVDRGYRLRRIARRTRSPRRRASALRRLAPVRAAVRALRAEVGP